MKTMKIFLVALLALILMVGMIACDNNQTTSGDGENEGEELKASEGLEFTSMGDGTCYVSGIGTCTDADLVIPSASPEGDEVVLIIGNIFSNCDLTSITFPKTLRGLACQGLWGSPRLTVDKRNPYLYSEGNCIIEKGRKAVLLGCGSSVIPNDIKRIEASAFYGCDELTDINIPESVISIGAQAFYRTEMYNNEENWQEGFLYIDGCLIKAPVGVEGTCEVKNGTRVIADNAFDSNGFLLCLYSEVILPDSVISIGASAFSSCHNLTSITIPKNVIHIGELPFYLCSELDTIVVDSENALYYSEGNCVIEKSTKALIIGCKNSVITADVKTIAPRAFAAALGLDEIIIPNGVTHIGEYAFSSTSLSGITLPKTLVEIDMTAFYACSTLENIYFEGTCAEWNALKKTDASASNIVMGRPDLGGGSNYNPPAIVVHCTDGDVPIE